MLMDKRSGEQQNTRLAKYIVQTIDKKQSGVSFEIILLY